MGCCRILPSGRDEFNGFRAITSSPGQATRDFGTSSDRSPAPSGLPKVLRSGRRESRSRVRHEDCNISAQREETSGRVVRKLRSLEGSIRRRQTAGKQLRQSIIYLRTVPFAESAAPAESTSSDDQNTKSAATASDSADTGAVTEPARTPGHQDEETSEMTSTPEAATRSAGPGIRPDTVGRDGDCSLQSGEFSCSLVAECADSSDARTPRPEVSPRGSE